MEKEIGLSFLIPSFNPPVDEFRKLLKTLLACTENVPMEIIIGDDSNNGFSFEKLKGAADGLSWNKVKFIKFQRMDLLKKRTLLMSMANFKYFEFLDCDDSIAPVDFEKVFNVVSTSDFDLVEFPIFVREKNVIKKRGNAHANRDDYLNDLLLSNSCNSLWSKIYKKKVFEDAFEYQRVSLPNLVLGDDKVINVILASCVRTIGYIDVPFYIYEQNSASISKTIDIASRFRDTEAAYSFYEKQLYSFKETLGEFRENFLKSCKADFCDVILSARPKTELFRKQVLLAASCCDTTLGHIFPSFWKSNVANIPWHKKMFISFYRQFVHVVCRSHSKT